MATIEHKGKSYNVDEDGFLADGMAQWDQDWVNYVMTVEGISELTDEHTKVIDALQEYYKKNGIAPMVRILSKTTGFPLKRIQNGWSSQADRLRVIHYTLNCKRKAASAAFLFFLHFFRVLCSFSSAAQRTIRAFKAGNPVLPGAAWRGLFPPPPDSHPARFVPPAILPAD